MKKSASGETDYGKEQIRLGRWDVPELEAMLRRAGGLHLPSERIGFLSRQFLGVPYRESTLIGSPGTREALVIDLASLDCFTYIDYVEAMRSSRSFAQFKEELRRVRYRSGQVTYEKRRHFFSDWCSLRRLRDVTRTVGDGRVIVVSKLLNRKADGSFFLPGITPVARKIAYLPVKEIGAAVLARLMTGDYVGIYSETAGLDVSHVGIVIREGNDLILRHASSIARKVVDQDFAAYVSRKPGITVLRPAARKPG